MAKIVSFLFILSLCGAGLMGCGSSSEDEGALRPSLPTGGTPVGESSLVILDGEDSLEFNASGISGVGTLRIASPEGNSEVTYEVKVTLSTDQTVTVVAFADENLLGGQEIQISTSQITATLAGETFTWTPTVWSPSSGVTLTVQSTSASLNSLAKLTTGGEVKEFTFASTPPGSYWGLQIDQGVVTHFLER